MGACPSSRRCPPEKQNGDVLEALVTTGGKASSPPVRMPAFPLGDSGISVPIHVSNGEPLGLLGQWQAREGCCGTALSLVFPSLQEEDSSLVSENRSRRGCGHAAPAPAVPEAGGGRRATPRPAGPLCWGLCAQLGILGVFSEQVWGAD